MNNLTTLSWLLLASLLLWGSLLCMPKLNKLNYSNGICSWLIFGSKKISEFRRIAFAIRFFGLVAQLEDAAALEAVCCGFESHQDYWHLWRKGIRSGSKTYCPDWLAGSNPVRCIRRCSPTEEATDLRSVKCGFESHQRYI